MGPHYASPWAGASSANQPAGGSVSRRAPLTLGVLPTEVPHVDLGRLDAKRRQRGADLAAVVGAVVEELGESDAPQGVAHRTVVAVADHVLVGIQLTGQQRLGPIAAAGRLIAPCTTRPMTSCTPLPRRAGTSAGRVTTGGVAKS